MPFFTESRHGYDKEEVNRYISKQSAEYEDKLNKKDVMIAGLIKETETLKEALKTKDDSEAEEFEEAKARYTELCAKMGEKLLLADEKAKEIIAGAIAESKRIINEAKEPKAHEATDSTFTKTSVNTTKNKSKKTEDD